MPLLKALQFLRILRVFVCVGCRFDNKAPDLVLSGDIDAVLFSPSPTDYLKRRTF